MSDIFYGPDPAERARESVVSGKRLAALFAKRVPGPPSSSDLTRRARVAACVVKAWTSHAIECDACGLVFDEKDPRRAYLDGFCPEGRALAFLALRRLLRETKEVQG